MRVENSVDSDQTALLEASWSGSTVCVFLKGLIRVQQDKGKK